MKPLSPHILAVSWLSIISASGGVLINELNINPSGPDDGAYQYAEILTTNANGEPESQTLGDVSLLFVDSNGNSVGEVREELHLEGLSTGSNGLLVIGIDFDTGAPEGWSFDSETAKADFSAVAQGGTGEIGPKGGMTAVLVEGFTKAPGHDLDGADNGEFGNEPWSKILDSVGYGDQPYETELQVDFSPDNLSRVRGENLQNSTTPWIGGDFLPPADPPAGASVVFSETFGSFTGTATPGATNPAPPAQNPIRINEVLVNPPNADGNVEFIELISTTEEIATTNNLWILIVDSDREGEVGDQGGEILEAWNLDGQATGTDGLLLLGNNYRRSSGPWKDIIPRTTPLFDPSKDNLPGQSGMGDGDIGFNNSDEDNEALTILLVSGFNGTVRDGLTRGTDIDQDDDGEIDTRPWDTSQGEQGILDSLGFDQLNDTTGEVWWATYAVGDATQVMGAGALGNALAEPDSFVRDPAKMEPNQGSAWMGGNIGGKSSTGIAYWSGETFGDYVTQVSPGQRNPESTPPQALVVINEVHLNPPGEDGNHEYIELFSPTRTFTAIQDLTLLIVDVDGADKGEIKNVIEIAGHSTGGNGLMIMGDGYELGSPYAPIPDVVNREDPEGLNVGEIGPNDGLAILLVQGFTGQKNDDLDTDNDGIFETTFWDSVMDSLAFGSELQEQDFIANFNGVGFIPDSFCRIPGNFDQYDVNAWYGGELIGEQPTSLVYGTSFGPYQGEASPGRFNLAGPRHAESILLNEVHLNPPGDDDNLEYIELISPTGGRQSTNDLSLVVLDNAGGDVGRILEVWHLDGMSTGDDGLLLLGNRYPPVVGEEFREGYWDRSLFPELSPTTPWGDQGVNDRVTAVGDPIDLGNNNIGPNNSFTIALVSHYDGEVGDDLDIDDNGVFDIDPSENLPPWDTSPERPDGVIDGVGFLQWDDNATPGFDGHVLVSADLSAEYDQLQTFQPDNISRKLDDFRPNVAAAWFGGNLQGIDPNEVAYDDDFFPSTGFSFKQASPGAPNGESDPLPDADDDQDGATNEEEAIAGTDPNDPSDYFRVKEAQKSAEGLVLTWTSVLGKAYAVQYSTTLEAGSWIDLGTLTGGESGTTQFTDDDPVRQAAPEGYYRIQVSAE